MGDPEPLDPVALDVSSNLSRPFSCQQSRSGPAVEIGGGVSQPSLSGKYAHVNIIHLPDGFSCSSTDSDWVHFNADATDVHHSLHYANQPPLLHNVPTLDTTGIAKPGSIGSTSSRSPGRTQNSTLGAPSDPVTVVPSAVPILQHCASRHLSRPGPVYGGLEGVSQPAPPGKYSCITERSVPDDLQNCSSTRNDSQLVNQAGLRPINNATLDLARPVCSSTESRGNGMPQQNPDTPGRNVYSALEALEPPDPVVLAVDCCPQSRPGPEVVDGERVFQPVLTGKYLSSIGVSLPDASSNCSSPLPCTLEPSASTATNIADATSELHIYYQNVRGLRTKIDQVFHSTSELDYDVYVFTETWLDDRIFSGQLFGSDYCVFRVDRYETNSERQRGGGVLIAVKRSYESSIIRLSSGTNAEQLGVRIAVEPVEILIGALYLPPEKSQNRSFVKLHLDVMFEVNRNRSDTSAMVLLGDFNQPLLTWRETNDGCAFVDPLQSQFTMASKMFLDTFAFLGLRQRNLIRNSDARVLDLVLCNETNMTIGNVVEAPEEVVPIDVRHPTLTFTVSGLPALSFDDECDFASRDFRRGDYVTLNRLLSEVDWSEVYSCHDVNSATNSFTRILHSCISQAVPPSRPPRKPVWSNARLRALRRRRSRSLQIYCQRRCPFTKRLFNEASHLYRGYNRFLYRCYIKRTQDSLRRNPKRFWNYVNSKRKESGFPSLMHLGDVQARTAEQKSELFARNFANVFVDRVPTMDDTKQALESVPRDVMDLDTFGISASMVESAVHKLKQSYNPGPDGIPSCVFKRCTSMLVTPLQAIFNQSLQQQQFPAAWKASYMIPVYKKGDKTDISNYRGITSLAAGSKCLEIIVNEVLLSACRNYISPYQHGFFPKRSVTSNLCEFVSTCIAAMDTGAQIDTIYTDIKAAFDTVNHTILLAKLQRLGVSDRMCHWLKSYLSNRQLCVKVGSAQSTWFSSPSGVPQGSNLGPLLFTLFFNDVVVLLANGGLLIYADDLKLYLIIRTEDDCRRLQELLDQFARWCSYNFLKVSVSKCHVISFSRRKRPISFNYMIDGAQLERVDKVKDLGVLLDCRMTFKLHYSSIIDKANRQLGFVLKVAQDFDDPTCLRALYCSLVRSILEYASVVWSPYEEVWSARIESVQRRFVRCALRNLPWRNPLRLPRYEDRCALLGIDTLKTRRLVDQAVFGAKILRAEIDSAALLERLRIYAPGRALRSREFIQPAARNTTYGSNDPVNSISRRFQDAYEYFDFNLSTNTFKNRLRALNVFR